LEESQTIHHTTHARTHNQKKSNTPHITQLLAGLSKNPQVCEKEIEREGGGGRRGGREGRRGWELE